MNIWSPGSKMEEERKRILEKENLEDLKNYLQEFSYFLPLPVCVVNPIGVITDVNRAFCDITGYKEAKVIGENVRFLFEKEGEWQDLKKLVSEKKTIRGEEAVLKKPKGETFPASIFVSERREKGGHLIGYFLAFSNISEFKKLQEGLEQKVEERTEELEEARSILEIKMKARTKELEELEKSRKALLNILEDVDEARKSAEEERSKTLAIFTNFADGLLFFNKEEKLSMVNAKAKKYLKIKGKDLTGKTTKELTKIKETEPLAEVFEREKIKEVFRKEIKISEGLTLEVSTIPISRGKEILGTLVSLHDVTREKMIEKMKTEFVSVAAHQLRTPLSAIKWTLKMVLDEDLGEINNEQEEFLQDTYKSNERMITLVNNLLNVTRIEEGRYLYETEVGDVSKIVEQVFENHKEQAAKKEVKLKLEKAKEDFPKTLIDHEKIQIAVTNLMDNAIKYTPAGGEVKISLEHDKEKISFRISDTGVGIPKIQQERMFTKFFRGSNVVRMETEGSGLGLFITKNIIEAHGGEIWFESEEGTGTTFYFTLPVVKK